MAGRNPQTMAKRAREQAVREKRERKQAKKAETAAAKRDGTYVAEDETLDESLDQEEASAETPGLTSPDS
jgi:hypothetical protein